MGTNRKGNKKKCGKSTFNETLESDHLYYTGDR